MFVFSVQYAKDYYHYLNYQTIAWLFLGTSKQSTRGMNVESKLRCIALFNKSNIIFCCLIKLESKVINMKDITRNCMQKSNRPIDEVTSFHFERSNNVENYISSNSMMTNPNFLWHMHGLCVQYSNNMIDV